MYGLNVSSRVGGAARSDLQTHRGAAPSVDPACLASGHEVFEALREAVTSEKPADCGAHSWARAAASMCRKVDDTLHLTMVSGSIFSHYQNRISQRNATS